MSLLVTVKFPRLFSLVEDDVIRAALFIVLLNKITLSNFKSVLQINFADGVQVMSK